MASRQIHELPSTTSLSGTDRIVVSTASGNLTRAATIDDLPFRSNRAGAVPRTLAAKLQEHVSVRDFGAVGDGVADDSAAFQAAVDSALFVYVPHGRYRLASRIKVKPNRTITGAGRECTTILAEAALAFEFFRNRGAYQIDIGATTDWNRSSIAAMTIQMSSGGILVHGHEFRAEDLQFRQGAPGSWCVQLHASNECYLHKLSGGYGGGAHGLAASAIRWYAGWAVTDPDDPAFASDLSEDDTAALRQAENTVNYGDGTLAEIAFKGNAVGWTGLKLEHLSPSTSSGVINNLHVNRCQFQAPGSSSEEAASTSVAAGSVWAKTGSIGLHLHKVLRCTFTVCDMEGTDTAIKASGNVSGLGGGATKFNTFIGCQSFNARSPWLDSNAEVEGSVGRNGFYGGQLTGPLQPRGDSADDSTIRAGQADFFFPMAAWFSNINRGEPRINIRVPDAATGFSDNQLLITSPGTDPARLDGSALDDAHPKQRHPSRGVRIYTGGVDDAVIGRPIGQTIKQNARLELGNGPNTSDTMGINGPLKAVVVRDPLYLTPWTAEPVAPYDNSVFFASTRSALPNTVDWRGAGWYMSFDDRVDGGTTAKAWLPVATRPGIMRLREVNASATIGRSDFGSMILGNHATTTIDLAIPSNLLREDEVGVNLWQPVPPAAAANSVQMRAAAHFWVERIGDARVRFVAGSGTTLVAQDGGAEVPMKGGLSLVVLKRTGIGALTAYIAHFGARLPGASYANPQRTTAFVIAASDFNSFIQVNATGTIDVTVPTGLLAAGTKAARLTLAQEGAGGINLVAGAGMTAKGETSIAAQGSVRTLWITERNEFCLQ
ncbi:MAG TPA: glycosyl hydrolase family 28-related protein [Geminicoccus sp.]|jgi:hypothetical protein|uniref:glycosyl hydrolase family 28-related protein n=1 Tax=Geminicoccus sp. TaxID=2024832 RepID=UPI002E346493|nr:glycosyl hydrolase family 28-related protein [Geminicoccus sp.]HEX2525789.1 glycosyl hydrolase family 28-related protein [Geminicoccus sp.]